MATVATPIAQRGHHWSRTSINRASLDKSLPSKPPRDQRDHSHAPNRKPDTSAMAPATTSSTPKSSSSTLTTVLIGPQKQRFKVNKKLLCAASPFFRERLEDPQHRSVSLWLPGELPSMFALFVDWLHTPRYNFRRHLDHVVAAAAAAAADYGPRALHDVHWALIRLHLFASHLSLYHLQDSAMDAIQDLYLSCDWDVPPGLLTYLYTRCDAIPAVRLRRWAVAMVAFSLVGSAAPSPSPSSTSTSSPVPVKLHPEYDWGVGGAADGVADDSSAGRFRQLIDGIPDLSDDYAVHMAKMASSGLDVRFKNPQLRIPANRLRNDERAFGFRECSFHSHRATVGERRCPHERKRLRSLAAAGAAGAANDVDDAGRAHVRRLLASELAGSPPIGAVEREQGRLDGGLTSPSRRPSQRENNSAPRLLFSEGAKGDEEIAQALKHVRSVSSTLK